MAAQQLNPADRLAVRPLIVARCQGIVANYANYILGEPTNTPNHANRMNWANSTIGSPETIGIAVSYRVLNDPAFLDGGSGISDGALTGAVEAAINTHFINAG
jgi:hypothetical protein